MIYKKFIVLLIIIESAGYCFSQEKKIVSADSIVQERVPAFVLPMERNIKSSLKKDIESDFIDSIRFMKSVISTTSKNIFSSPLKLTSFNSDYNGFLDRSYLYAGSEYFNELNTTTSWMVFSVPVSISYRNESWLYAGGLDPENFSFHYDRNNYLTQLKTRLNKKFRPEELLNKITDPFLSARQNAKELLQRDLVSIDDQYGNLLKESIRELGNPDSLLTKEIPTIRQKILSNEYVKSISEKEKLYSQLIQKKNAGESFDPEQLAALDSALLTLKGKEALINKIEEHKHKWDSSGLIKKMKEWNLLQTQSLSQLMSNPSNTIKAARENLNLNGLEKLFLKVDKLNAGQNSFSLSPLSIQHFLNNGLVTQFLNNKNYLMLMAGKLQDYSSILDKAFTNNIFSNEGMAKSISFGAGMNSSSRSHITLASYNQTLSSFNLPATLNTFRRSLVTTLSNELNIGKNGSLTTEISRSSTDYVNDSTQKNGLKKIVSGDDFWKNTAISLRYEDEYVKQNLSYGIHLSKTANDYNNPGNMFINSASKELGYSVRKIFWKKLQVSLKTDVREFKYNDEINDRWRNIYSVFDLRLKLKKGQSVGIRYLPSKMIRIDSSARQTMSELNRLAADANLVKKIAGIYYRDYLNLSVQKNEYYFNNEQILNNTVYFYSSQSFTIKKNVVFVNTSYNYSDNHSQYVYFNSSFVSEAGSTYILLKKINASSSLTYNAVSGWYEQVGLRQTVSTQIGQRFSMNLYVDARKNIRIYQPLWYGQFRADVSIHYQLKN